jgi:hypothetical protein
LSTRINPLENGTLQRAVVFAAREADGRWEIVVRRLEKNAITRLLPFEKPSNRIFSRQPGDPSIPVGTPSAGRGSFRESQLPNVPRRVLKDENKTGNNQQAAMKQTACYVKDL